MQIADNLKIMVQPDNPPLKGGSNAAFWRNPDTIDRLYYAFKIHANIKQACAYARISRSSYYEFRKKYPDFSGFLESAKYDLIIQAKAVIAEAIFAGDVKSSWMFLDRTDPELSKYTAKYRLEQELVKQHQEQLDLPAELVAALDRVYGPDPEN